MSNRTLDTDRPQVDGYRIVKVIGHGGMSTVYLADQTSLGRKVALKVMLPEALADEVSRGRFENEAGTIARMQHPNIVGIHEVGRTSEGLPFYSMPYLSHGHLAQRDLRGDQPRVAEILRVLLQALDYAHVRGVVHRDVKAENVLFDDNERPQLADFGIALRRGSNPRLTSTGLAVGSTAYMPPEQARGATVDRRADLYSLGVLTWEMLTGSLPYNAGDALSMAMMHVQNPVPRLPASLKHWQGLIDKSMAKNPDDRYASAQDMLEALEQIKVRAGKHFGIVEVPQPATDGGNSMRRGIGWKPVALATAVLVGVVVLAFGLPRLLSQGSDALPGQPETTGIDASTSGGLPVPSAKAGEGVLGGINPTTTAGMSAYLANAEQQLRDGQLLAPTNGNAWDSLDAARRVNPTDLQMLMLSAHLFDALGNASEQALSNGDASGARQAFDRARELDARRGGDGSAIVLLRKRLEVALTSRLAVLIAKPDRSSAEALLANARWVGLDPARSQALQARLARLPVNATTGTSAANGTSAPPPPVEILTVSRTEYSRFANETARAAADCGRTGFLGTTRRSWKVPGDKQADSAPVVCVSADDANAYARWLSAHEKRRYRLPSVGEARSQATSPVSGWLTLCADNNCSKRVVSGKPKPLDADRGYNDVGIRLVREG
ncbi:bifunctional serine/threonine-protein kinase/formylglycine-generating enzyme family protein [Thermomonas sp.]|uniref:bifunctional serine/threonine-protein kinase/formylglycine-generating enzyme family protein n=1 Tax=Thermomonas sp. TaxID=1971895 RepID=UPI0024871525|nr:bifunctional serine/threonine-protein kinase/formylglycine-generating enzyme family protein [Thermomonas sp.]MDI1252064.1 bifunctional serine/threonine-protein kinase/formylglycine-generating enzyme family protein [Thermomonas sp.]